MINVVAGILVQDRKLLIGFRPKHSVMGGVWELPGGKVKPTETKKSALIREFKEELGISITVNECLWHGTSNHNSIEFYIEFYSVSCECIKMLMPYYHDEIIWASRESVSTKKFADTDWMVIEQLIVSGEL